MITLEQAGRTGGDEIAPYSVKMDKVYTVAEFIDEIEERREWGGVTISYIPLEGTSDGEKVRVDYKSRKTERGYIPESVLRMKVTKAFAGGGWGNMDYHINAV